MIFSYQCIPAHTPDQSANQRTSYDSHYFAHNCRKHDNLPVTDSLWQTPMHPSIISIFPFFVGWIDHPVFNCQGALPALLHNFYAYNLNQKKTQAVNAAQVNNCPLRKFLLYFRIFVYFRQSPVYYDIMFSIVIYDEEQHITRAILTFSDKSVLSEKRL